MIWHFIIEITRWGYMGCSWQLTNLSTDFASILQLNRHDTCEMVLKEMGQVYWKCEMVLQEGLERSRPSVHD